MNLLRSSFIVSGPPFTACQNRIHQRCDLLFPQGEIGHIRHGMLDRTHQFIGGSAGRRGIEADSQAVAPPSADMAAATGKLFQQLFTLHVLQGIAKGKAGVLAAAQPGVCDIFPGRCRVAQMAAAAPAPLRIVNRVARQTELTRLSSPRRRSDSKQQRYQNTSDQFAPRKNIATTVSSTIAAAAMTVPSDTGHCSRGNQTARWMRGTAGSQGSSRNRQASSRTG